MSAPTIQQIRDAIKAKIVAVGNTGNVHTYERYAKEQSKLLTLYQSGVAPNARILGWHIRRTATRELFPDTGRWVVDHDWKIRGFMSLDDADSTELTFDTLIESIRDAFRDDDSLGGLIFSTVIDNKSNQAGVQVDETAPVLFAGVLCHSARLSLTTRHLL